MYDDHGGPDGRIHIRFAPGKLPDRGADEPVEHMRLRKGMQAAHNMAQLGRKLHAIPADILSSIKAHRQALHAWCKWMIEASKAQGAFDPEQGDTNPDDTNRADRQ